MKAFLIIGVKCLAAMLVGVFEGNGAVYFFNRMPAQWFCDYGEKPSEDMLDPFTQRVKSTPWKYIFTMLFVAINIWLVMDSVLFALAATASIWLLLEMSIGDIKYGIIPDQLIVLLAVSGIGFIPWHGSWQECLLGTAVGFGFMALIAILGRIAYRKTTLGGGDIKLFSALGFITGPAGIIAVFIMTTLISSAHYVWLLASKKIKKSDTMPMVPYIAVATVLYFLFLWGRFDHIVL